jgi:hypothetical protein
MRPDYGAPGRQRRSSPGQYANPFTTRSLEDYSDHEGLRPVDMLAHPSLSAWLEEMGATVH